MRLIDAEQIRYMWQEFKDGEWSDGVTLQSVIRRMPTIDAVKVIRCKDCKHYQEWDDGNPSTCRMWTDQWDMPTEPNGYCHYGELKD
jgi:hypothetical protein